MKPDSLRVLRVSARLGLERVMTSAERLGQGWHFLTADILP
jgi:hypothetical protein